MKKVSKPTQRASAGGAEHRPPPPPSRTPKDVDLDWYQPLWGPRVFVLFDVQRLSEHVVSA